MDLREYGIILLKKHLAQSESYIDYVIDLLNQDQSSESIRQSQLFQFFIDCHLDEKAIPDLIKKLTTIKQRGYASEEDVQQLQSSSSNENNLVSQRTVTEGDRSIEDDNEEDPLSNDVMTLSSSEFDWITLLDSLESHLSTSYQYTQPEFSPPALMIALYKGYYQVDYAAQLLLNAVQVLNQCKPCRHLMQQGCFRRDCHFDHDLTRFPCRYWLHSVCANSPQMTQNPINSEGFLADLTENGSCVFSHDLPDFQPQYYVTNPTDTETSQSTNTPTTVIEEDFPSLGVSNNSSNTKKGSTTSYYASAVVKAQQPTNDVIADFPTLSMASNTKGSKKQNKPASTSMSSSMSRGSGSSGGVYGVSGSSGGGANGVSSQRKLFSELLERAQFIPTSSSSHGHSNRVNASDWVESGDVIRYDYEKLREEARQYAIGRNKLLQEATIAYMSGSKQSAKSLSAQGQAMNQQMKQLHIQAAKAIFRNRNSLHNLEAGKVDLHGLHVSEAVDCVTELIPIYDKSGIKRLTIVTGSGHHTKGPQQGKARLLPYVRDLCENQLRLRVQEVKDHSGYSGGLIVTLT